MIEIEKKDIIENALIRISSADIKKLKKDDLIEIILVREKHFDEIRNELREITKNNLRDRFALRGIRREFLKETVKGEIALVSSTGGIKFKGSDKWFNPASTARIKFTSNDIGKAGLLFLTEKGYYKDFLDESLEQSRNEDLKVLESSFDKKSLDIHRQVALKCAVDYCKELSVRSTRDVLDKAEVFETWLNRRLN
jgi:hypothetical protein